MHSYRKNELLRKRKEKREKRKNFEKVVKAIYKKLLDKGVKDPHKKAREMAYKREMEIEELLSKAFSDAYNKVLQE